MKRLHSLVVGAVTVGALALAGPAASATGPSSPEGHAKASPFTFAVIGDIPYGDAQFSTFEQKIAQINADPAVRLVDHLGDIKSGSTRCDDTYFDAIKADFDEFSDPLVYTPGDNEWTDCHRPNNGAYNPLERLDKIRTVFFGKPGRTLGKHSVRVRSEAAAGYPENVRYRRSRVSFAAVHIVGSNNSLAPWTGNTTPTPEQSVEVLGRTASAIQTIHETFGAAKAHRDRAVVLLTQADMFDPTVGDPVFSEWFAFQPIVAAIARESAAYSGQVYLFNGDSHFYNNDNPLAAGSSWLAFYHLAAPVKNLNRVTIDGSTQATNYLRVTVHPKGKQVLTWTQVPFTS